MNASRFGRLSDIRECSMIGEAQTMANTRRTADQIAAAQHEKAQRARERAERRVKRRAEASEKAWARYQAELGGVARREAERQFQQDGIDYLAGHDTEGARRFAAVLAQRQAAVSAAEKRLTKEADPLNLTGHSPRPNEARVRRAMQTAAEKAGVVREPISHEDGSRPLITALPHSLRWMKKLTIVEQMATANFQQDFHAAEAGLSASGIRDKVDISGVSGGISQGRMEAERRKQMCRASVGERNWDILVKVLIGGWNASTFHRNGARDHRSVNSDIDVAINALVEFYYPGQSRRDPTWKACAR